MDDSDKEKRHDPKKRKKEKKVRVATTDEKKKKRSKWWAHFTDNEEDPTFASCKYCQQLIGCSTKNGTTPLANHISRCKKYPPNLDKKQKLIDFESRILINEDGTTETELRKLGGGPSEDDWKRMVLKYLFDAYASSMPSSNMSGTSSSTSTSFSTFTQSGAQTGRKVDLQQLMTSKYQRDTGCSLTNANKNWLRTSRSPLIIEENLLVLEELEEGMKNLTLEQPDIIIDETINSLDEF
ncbi:hypothetical protein V6N12_037705 [Hibiscus sabdariffa]|uniref:BED-type domain-containing protein n=1 Tax=Hibiscus sabdariffa TaxID=183260 RepID=A0ABR2C1G2_9ROSI